MKNSMPNTFPRDLFPSVKAGLSLLLIASSLTAATVNWTGAAGDSQWSSAGNWDGSLTSADTANFGSGTGAITLTSPNTITSLTFTGTADGYVLSGDPLTIARPSGLDNWAISNTSGATQTIAANLELEATSGSYRYINADGSSHLILSGQVKATGGSDKSIYIKGGGVVDLTGTLSGVNLLIVQGGTTLNYQTTTSTGYQGLRADGGRINLVSATGTSGINVSLLANNSEIHVVGSSDRTIASQYLSFNSGNAGATQTFMADITGGGTASYTGTVRLGYTANPVTNQTFRLAAAAGNVLDFTKTITDSTATSFTGAKVEIVGPGVVRFSGSTDDNTSVLPILISSGRLELNKSGGKVAIAGGHVTIASAGELRLLGADQIADATALTLDGGLFNANNFSESLGVLTVTANGGTIDLGGVSGTITLASLASIDGGLLIKNWSGDAQIQFTDVGGWDASALEQVSFEGMGPGAALNGNFLVALTVIPEPAAWAWLFGLGSLTFSVRRRRRRCHCH